jgi:16S rRNA (cytidine1402-2'-O)-methyltransferase
MAETLGTRQAAVTRELTKKFEEVKRDTLAGLATHYRSIDAPKGEIVIVVGPPDATAPLCQHEVDVLIENALQRLSLKDAVAEITSVTGLPRKDIYARALQLSGRE